MKIKFVRACQDKHSGEMYRVGQVKEFDDERALEIIATRYAVEVKEEPKVDALVHLVQQAEAQKATENVALEATNENVALQATNDAEYEPVHLSELSKAELIEIAKDLGVAIRGTKEELIERILNTQDAE